MTEKEASSAFVVLIVAFLATGILNLPIYWLFIYLHHRRMDDRET